jgi:sterol desaturase/sphingolipid hydroxylase (fatty acid hydroxylase superfamily)
MNFTVNQELIVRISVFTGVLLLMLIWEQLSSRRPRTIITWRRRFNNLLLVAIDTLLVRLLLPLAAVSTAAIVAIHDFGLFNRLGLNTWFAGCLSFLLLDLIIYFQHRLFHKNCLLWRLHRVHHSDTEFDTTTGIRFHPLEIILSMCIKIAAVALLGPPIIAVIVFEIVLSVTSLFNHGNVHIPVITDRYLRWILVTPDMHRVHHSAIKNETNSNYGFNIPWWDRLFLTYLDQPVLGHEKLKVGLTEFRDRRFVNVLWLLKQPLLNSAEFVDNSEQDQK